MSRCQVLDWTHGVEGDAAILFAKQSKKANWFGSHVPFAANLTPMLIIGTTLSLLKSNGCVQAIMENCITESGN